MHRASSSILLRRRVLPPRDHLLVVCRSMSNQIKSITDHATVGKSPITSQLWEQRRKMLEKDGAFKNNQTSTTSPSYELLEKSVRDSRMSVRYQFTEDNALRHLYLDSNGEIQIGKLLEDLDALAGNVAQVHCDDGDKATDRLNLVTASVDTITQAQPITMSKDYVLLGQMAYVGRSSMDILIQLHTCDNFDSSTGQVINSQKSVLQSYFTFAARHSSSGKAAAVNKLKPETSDEINLFAMREQVARARKNNKTPTSEHQLRDVLTPLVERGSAIYDMPALAHPNAVLMARTVLENCFICQPQKVNTAGAIFGGFMS